MTENEKLEFAQAINDELLKDGIQMHASINTALVTGGIDTVRRRLGFRFYKWMSTTVKIVSKFLTGKTLSFAVYKNFSIAFNRIFGIGIPIVGVISIIWTVADIPGMVNPRDYDKFIPAVFIIGLSRLSKEDT